MTKREDFIIVKFDCGRYGARMANRERFLDLGIFLTNDTWPNENGWTQYCKSRFKWWVEYKIGRKIRFDNKGTSIYEEL